MLCMCCYSDGESDWALALAFGGQFMPVFIKSRVQRAPAAQNTVTLFFLADAEDKVDDTRLTQIFSAPLP